MTNEAIDTKAFRSMNYGMYIISTKRGDELVGCVVNTFQQVTSKPARVSVAINKENYTAGAVLEAGRFEATVLSESASMELIGRFGFKTSAEIDKFAETPHSFDEAGVPFVTEGAVAHIGASEPPMTYAYYHQVKGGKTPPKASSYEEKADEPAVATEAGAPQEDAKPRSGWRCMICGYVVEMDELPDDFTCPMCGMGRDMFERIEL